MTSITYSNGQEMSYTPFKGKVYKYPSQLKYIPFQDDYADRYPLIKEFSWDSIHVDQRDTDKGFPDVDCKGAFGIMFTSVLSIDTTSMYRFAITSDDGSIVWLDGEKIIDNDFSKGMHTKEDTLALRPGEYKMNIWYYQAYPTMFGVIYESQPVDAEVKWDIDTISLSQDLLFDLGSSQLNKKSDYLLDSLSQLLMSYENVKVRIVGHTDNIGSLQSNIILSQRRADSIREYLQEHVDQTGVIYYTRGRGETMPIANNDTRKGRARNRRVEILIEGF